MASYTEEKEKAKPNHNTERNTHFPSCGHSIASTNRT